MEHAYSHSTSQDFAGHDGQTDPARTEGKRTFRSDLKESGDATCSSPLRFSKSSSDCGFSGQFRAQWPILRHRAHRVRNFSRATFNLLTLGLNSNPEFCRPVPFLFPVGEKPRACSSLHNSLTVGKPVGLAARFEETSLSSKSSLESSVSRWKTPGMISVPSLGIIVTLTSLHSFSY